MENKTIKYVNNLPVNESIKPENLPFIQKSPLLQRVDYIKEMCRGKKVLHLGCANYPYTESSIENGTNLHLDLMNIAGELYGFDYDQPGIDILERHGVKNLYRADAERLEDVPMNETFAFSTILVALVMSVASISSCAVKSAAIDLAALPSSCAACLL